MRAMSANQSGPINWDMARQVAHLLATQPNEQPGIDPHNPDAPGSSDSSDFERQVGQAGGFDMQQLFAQGNTQIPSEANVDPTDRIELENLLRVAELQVGQATGLDTASASPRIVNRTTWVEQTLRDWKPMLEALATSLAGNAQDAPTPDSDDPMAAIMSMSKLLGPSLIAMQVGGMIGQMSTRAFGAFDFPVPRNATNPVELIAPNITSLATDWSLPKDQLNLFVCVSEVTRTAVMNQPHVANRLKSLMTEYVSGFRPDSDEAQQRLGQFEPTDEASMANMFSDPRALLGAIQTAEQRVTLQRTNALLAAFVGYVDHITNTVVKDLVPTHAAIEEALKRRRVEETEAQRLGEELLGLELSQTTFDRGTAFVNGVLERAGEEGLGRLWKSEADLPNPAEIDAPGLWLARIDLPSV